MARGSIPGWGGPLLHGVCMFSPLCRCPPRSPTIKNMSRLISTLYPQPNALMKIWIWYLWALQNDCAQTRRTNFTAHHAQENPQNIFLKSFCNHLFHLKSRLLFPSGGQIITPSFVCLPELFDVFTTVDHGTDWSVEHPFSRQSRGKSETDYDRWNTVSSLCPYWVCKGKS